MYPYPENRTMDLYNACGDIGLGAFQERYN